MDSMEQRNSFLRSNPCVACILVFKPLARCTLRALGVSHQLFPFFRDMIDEVLMILIPHIPSCTV